MDKVTKLGYQELLAYYNKLLTSESAGLKCRLCYNTQVAKQAD